LCRPCVITHEISDTTFLISSAIRHHLHRAGAVLLSRAARRAKKRINTTTQFLDHLTNDEMPALIDRLAAGKGIA
jgi:hypothetical protein